MVSRAIRKQGLNICSQKAVSGAGIDAETELAASPYARVRDALRREKAPADESTGADASQS